MTKRTAHVSYDFTIPPHSSFQPLPSFYSVNHPIARNVSNKLYQLGLNNDILEQRHSKIILCPKKIGLVHPKAWMKVPFNCESDTLFFQILRRNPEGRVCDSGPIHCQSQRAAPLLWLFNLCVDVGVGVRVCVFQTQQMGWFGSSPTLFQPINIDQAHWRQTWEKLNTREDKSIHVHYCG